MRSILLIVLSFSLFLSIPIRAQEQTKESGAKEPDVVYVPTPQAVVNLMLELAIVKRQTCSTTWAAVMAESS